MSVEEVKDQTVNTLAIMLWDGENRMRGISDNGYMSLYWYDADGNRTVKRHNGGEMLYVNSRLLSQQADTAAYSLYPNGWFGIDNFSRFSRHVYIGSERIATVTEVNSNGMSEYDNDDLQKAGVTVPESIPYDSLLAVQSSLVAAYSDSLRVPYSGSPEAVRSARSLGITGGLGVGHGNGSGDNADNSRTAANDSVFYYHRDHLGSTMSVTDQSGNIVQQVEYTPWGEVFLEKRNGSYFYSPYLFNGKELDEETGLYYYGARYYDPRLSVWYSTDPMQEKYPWVSTYCYTLLNPISAIDSDGNLVIFINGMHWRDGGKAVYWGNLNDRIMDIVKDNHRRYYDGSLGGALNTISHGVLTSNLNPLERMKEGMKIGYKDAEHIFSSLKQGETIKVFTHSMGAAYGKGFIIGLKTYAKMKNIDISKILEFEVDLAPFQPIMQSAVIGVKTVSIGHYWDGVAGPSLMPLAENHNTRFYKYTINPLKEHSVKSFTQKELIKYIPKVNGIEISNGKKWEQYGAKEEK